MYSQQAKSAERAGNSLVTTASLPQSNCLPIRYAHARTKNTGLETEILNRQKDINTGQRIIVGYLHGATVFVHFPLGYIQLHNLVGYRYW
jgi:hypothetical protein